MARLDFNEYGVLPPGIHRVGWVEMVRLLGFNEGRLRMIASGLLVFLGRLKRFDEAREVFIDGSFATAKENPGDVDGYLPARFDGDLSRFLEERRDEFKRKLRVDFYPALTDWDGRGSVEFFHDIFKATAEDPPRLKGYLAVADWRKHA